MSRVHEFVDKCLAECPPEAVELLFGELARSVIARYPEAEHIEIADRSGLVGHLIPAVDESEFPELAEILQRESQPDEAGIPADKFIAEMEAAIADGSESLTEKHDGTRRSAGFRASIGC